MGNSISKDAVDIKCPICKNSVIDYKIFLDIACSKCKKRVKEYYHKPCFEKTDIKNKTTFLCFDCQ